MPALRPSTTLSLVTAAVLAVGTVAYGGHQLQAATSSSAGTARSALSGGSAPVNWGDSRPSSGYGRGYSVPGSVSGSAGAATATGSTTEATAGQVRGVVDIVTTVDYGTAQAAGTGVVLTSDGEVLTNNHVVDGATTITVTVLGTGRSYPATVVGTSPTDDIAVLRLSGARGLTTAPMGDSSTVAVGDPVTGVGNAGNDVGTSASTGRVTALDQPVTASNGDGSSETVTGMIQASAPIQPGDSGGPLLDRDGKVVGIDTAAQTSGYSGETVAGYAIPINHALDVATQILAGTDNGTIHHGLPAFLGVQTAATGAAGTDASGSGGDPFGSGGDRFGTGSAVGVPVVGVIPGSAAETAGLQPGDTITAVGGTTVSSTDELTAALAVHSPGDRVTLSWTDASGADHTATTTLGAGPAD